MLDNQIQFETPEGIELHLVPAGPIIRILAFSIDLAIRLAILLVLSLIFSGLGGFGSGLLLVLYFLLEWFYSVMFEMFNDGATPGKKAMQIKVVHDDGTPLSWGPSILRNILRAADFFPFSYLSGVVCMLSSNGFKRIGDHVAATLVVYQETADKTARWTITGSRPAPFSLAVDEQQAILAFAERSRRLSPSRQVELANILSPLMPTTSEKDLPVEIIQIANGIVGDIANEKAPS